MIEFLLAGGIFTPAIVVLGVITLTVNFVQLRAPEYRHLTRVSVGLIVATLCVGLVGTGIGLYQAGNAELLNSTHILPVVGIASATTTLAAMFAAFNSVLCGIVSARSARAQ